MIIWLLLSEVMVKGVISLSKKEKKVKMIEEEGGKGEGEVKEMKVEVEGKKEDIKVRD